MSYEHSDKSNRFNLPNPMKVQNLFMGIAGAVCFTLGVNLLFIARGEVAQTSAPWQSIASAMFLILLGGWALFETLTQLKFFFGRGRPRSLTREIPRGKSGNNPGAEELKETLRHQAIVYPEPRGALDGLLMSLVPNLLYAPLPIRSLAQVQFGKAIRMLLLLLFLCVTLIGGGKGVSPSDIAKAQAWIGLFGMGWIVVLLIGSTGAKVSARAAQATLSPFRITVYTTIAILGPVLLAPIASSFPGLGGFTPFPHVFVIIALSFCAYALIFLTLLKEGNEAPPTGVTQVQEAWSMNCHPGQVMGEFDRLMQEAWRDQIPNRVYSRIEPSVDPSARTGAFVGEAMEEFQPLPLLKKSLSLGDSLRNPGHRMLVGLTVFSFLAYLACGLCVFCFGFDPSGNGVMAIAPHVWLVYGVVFFAVASMSHGVAHDIWARFDFDSVLIFCEMRGQYVTAELQHGNIMRDAAKATSSVTQVESMTFRLWVATLQTVCFGKDGQRIIRGIEPEPEAARKITERLKAFAQNQAMILAPTSQVDMERRAKLLAMNEPVPPVSMPMLPPQAPPALQEAPSMPATGRFCGACGVPVKIENRFCGACGAAQ